MLRVPSTVTAPATITLTFKSPVFGPDLTNVTAVALNVLRRDGTTGSWAMTTLSATPAELIAQYQFLGTELTSTGLYFLAPELSVSSGSVAAQTVSLFVDNEFSFSPQLDDSAWVGTTVAIPAGWSTSNHGATSARPTRVPGIGFQYFDTTLGIPIFWNGSVWKNASGASV